MRSQSTTGPLCTKARPAWPLRARRAVAALALLSSAAVHASSLPVQQVSVGFANANLMGPISALTMPDPNNCGTPLTPPCAAITATDPLITGGTAQSNYTALTFVTNSYTSTLDVIYGDAAQHTIWLSKGPGYTTSTAISGPPCPTGMAADPSGNVIVISRKCPGSGPGVWILPMITSGPMAGTYGAPLLIDNTFDDPNTGKAVNSHALAEVVVAGTAGPLWGTGDVIVLVSPVSKNDDRSGLRVIVYSQAAVKSVLASQSALHGPTSNLVTLAQFTTQSVGKVAPVAEGMDIGKDPNGDVTLYFPTADGRIIDFDSSMNAFTTPYVIKQGTLGRLRTFTWGAKQYVIVAQQPPGSAGQILQFDGSSNTTPFASVSTGVDNPAGLAVTYSASALAGKCINNPQGCQFTSQFALEFTGSGTTNIDPNATIVLDGCIFIDDRVTFAGQCPVATTLDLADKCPNMPHVMLPKNICGAWGVTGGSIGASINAAKLGSGKVNQHINNTFTSFLLNPSLVLPGNNPQCGDPNGPIAAYAPVPGVEPPLPENGFIDITVACTPDPPPKGGGNHASVVLQGTVNAPLTAPYIDGEFGNLQTAFTDITTGSAPTVPPPPPIGSQIMDTNPPTIVPAIQGFITHSQSYFDQQNYNCALNTLYAGVQYVNSLATNSPADFIAGTPPYDINPSGTLLMRLDHLYYDVYILGGIATTGHSPPPLTTDALNLPASSVPACGAIISFTVVNAATGAAPSSSGGHFLLPETTSYSVVWTTTGETQCTLTTTDGLFNNANEPANSVFGSSPVSFIVAPEGARGESGEGTLQTATLTCGALQASFQYIMQEAFDR